MTLRTYKFFTVLVPVLIIGGFEYIRHEYLLQYLTMEAGNFTITVITLLLSYLFASWMFNRIERSNETILRSEARRAVFEERERVAQELHDDLAQTLFFLNVTLRQGNIEEAKAAVSEIDNSLRQAIFNLRTPPEESASLGQRIHTYLANWRLVTGIELQETIQLKEDSFTPTEEVQLFGIIQEAFTNIRKHSMATVATLQLETDSSGWQLRITDNGCGFRLDALKDTTYGIKLMQKRASDLGASLSYRSEQGAGTDVIVLAKREEII